MLKSHLEDYFWGLIQNETQNDKEGKVKWRLSCYDSGRKLVDFIEENYFPLSGKHALDSACAWGGHILAFGEAGSIVSGCDLIDHQYDKLKTFAKNQGIHIELKLANCENLPFDDHSINVILGLELIEHIDSPEKYASEISRLLAPDGVCIISTPSRWKSIFWGEPHYQLKWLTLLPFRLQRMVAVRLFGKKYPYPITRQYGFARNIIKHFKKAGLTGYPYTEGKLYSVFKDIPILSTLIKELLWDFVIICVPDQNSD